MDLAENPSNQIAFRAGDASAHKRLEQPQLDTEKLMSAVFDALPEHTAVLDDAGTIIAVNQAWRMFAEAKGFGGNALGVGSNYLAVLNAATDDCVEQAPHVAAGIRAVLAGRRDAIRVEYPCHSPTERRWFQCRANRVADLEQVCVVVAHKDITAVRLAQEALRALNACLIEAQENERRRIGRELHDDVNQRLALLAVELDRFAQKLPESAGEALAKVQGISTRAKELSSDLQHLSYRLHPAKLAHLGLAAALKSFCKEFEQPNDIRIQFIESGVPASIPFDTSLCLYRIAQEALHNVVKHGGVDEARVELTGSPAELRLCVCDSGIGFDPASAKGCGGLGLASMRERLHLVGGALSVQSEPRHGTRIEAWVPLASHSIGSKEHSKTPSITNTLQKLFKSDEKTVGRRTL